MDVSIFIRIRISAEEGLMRNRFLIIKKNKYHVMRGDYTLCGMISKSTDKISRMRPAGAMCQKCINAAMANKKQSEQDYIFAMRS